MGQKSNFRKILLLTPLFGTLLFTILYITAALLYPGGSQIDTNSQGFSWVNNYWCNLLCERALNGQPNSAKSVADAGLFVLCATLSFFWIVFSNQMHADKKLKLTIKVCGPVSMIISLFLFTNINHDIVTNLASLFGIIATLATLIGLYKIKWFILFFVGLFNLLLVALNNYVYHSSEMIIHLPIIQKISFLSFLIWVCWINIRLYRQKQTVPTFIE